MERVWIWAVGADLVPTHGPEMNAELKGRVWNRRHSGKGEGATGGGGGVWAPHAQRDSLCLSTAPSSVPCVQSDRNASGKSIRWSLEPKSPGGWERAWVHGRAGGKLPAPLQGVSRGPQCGQLQSQLRPDEVPGRTDGLISPQSPRRSRLQGMRRIEWNPPQPLSVLHSLSSQGLGSIRKLLLGARGCTEFLTCEDPLLPRLHSSGTLGWPWAGPLPVGL